MTDGANAKWNVITYMESHNVMYTDTSSTKGQSLSFEWTTDVISEIVIDLAFDVDGRSIHLATMFPLVVPTRKLPNALIEINRCNRTYRWIDFFLDEEDAIHGEIDAIIEPNTAGEEVFELLDRTLDICDEVYPIFTKLIVE